MPKISLSPHEIDELIAAYRSNLKKMRFQINQVNDAIKELQELKQQKLEAKEKKVAVKAAVRKKPGRKPKRGRKPRKTKGYRLSDWDEFVINSIREKGLPMSSAELVEAGTKHSKDTKLGLDEEQVKGKIARSLQKLANKRGVLGKASSRGKGYVYGVDEWFFARSGRLKKAYQV